jgi:hypothetical protein
MTLEELLIAVVRVAGSLLVLRWALVGAVVAIATDLSDLFLRNFLHLGGVSNYQVFDKWLDQVYMAAFLVVAVRDWRGVPRRVAVALYCYRLVGFAAYGLTGERSILLFFPNVFEFWFLFVASLPHWHPGWRYSRRATAVALGALTTAKLAQEYALHQARWLDTFTTIDVINALWSGLSWPFRAII